MQHREHGKVDTNGSAPNHADAPEGAGWMDRLTLLGAGPEGALRPRLPYPFQAMKFAHDEVAPEWPGRASVPPDRTPPPEAPRMSAAASAGDVRAARAIDRLPERAPARSAPQSVASEIVPAAASPAPRPTAPARAVGPAAQPAPARGTMQAARPLHAREPDIAPAAPARLVPAARSNLPAASPPPPVAAAPATLTISAPLPASGAASPAPQPDHPAPLRPAPAAARQPASTLRSASPRQAPLPATVAPQSAPEITIDIHIGRIDVRAPAAPPPVSAAAAAPRSGDALQAYLLRRGRGARS